MYDIVRKSLILLGLLSLSGISSAQVHKTEQIEVELVAETRNVVPGQTLWLGIRLDPIEHWHTYWKFGGDSGEPTQALDWQLPEGAVAGDIVWPTPEWTPFLGSDLVTFTYEREVYLPLPVTIPADLDSAYFELSTTIEWQVCEQICIPGDAQFSLRLPVADTAELDPRWQQGFADARAQTPVPIGSHDLVAQFNDHDGKVNVMIKAPDQLFEDVDEAWFFPTQRRIMKYAPYHKLMKDGDRLQVSTEQHRRFDPAMQSMEGLLAFVDRDGNQQAFDIAPQKTSVAWAHSIEVELLAQSSNIVPGEPVLLGLRLDAAEHWHTYWKMGGDSGEPTSLNEWAAPEGTTVGEIQWPAPHWLPFYDTDLVNFGYEEEVILPIEVTIPADFEGDSVELSTLAFWNVCEQICIPGDQRLSLTLPIGDSLELDATTAQQFASALEKLPTTDHDISSIFAAAGERVSLGFESAQLRFDDYVDAWFFPDQRRVIKYGPLRDVTIGSNLLQITHNQPRRMIDDLSQVFGVLVLEDAQGQRASYEFVNPAADALTSSILPLAGPASASSGGGGSEEGGLLFYMFAAMLGGLILNLMPCVFPVLSLKAMSFASNAGASVHRQRMDGLVYTAGVLAAFVALATVLIVLRAGGERIGWGFQLQQPWFLALIVYLFFTMGLSMSGVFEMGTSLMGVGGGLAESKGYKGSFFTGVLATVVATPCTAPFMGPALGFALTQPWVVAILVFIALGFGMALPILVLSYIPALARLLPRPGAWMVTFKEFMAFPMYAAALFFLWALGNQVGSFGISAVLAACILIAMAAWLYQKRLTIGTFWRRANAVVAMACVVFAIYILQSPYLEPVSIAAAAPAEYDEEGNLIAGTADFEAFSAQRLDELQAAGKPVFVNMTASWCITCLANERSSLSTDRVKEAMEANGITYMKGDWTNEDPEITAVLERFNRPSVPLYILYSGDTSVEPQILPQILTPGTVVEAFENI